MNEWNTVEKIEKLLPLPWIFAPLPLPRILCCAGLLLALLILQQPLRGQIAELSENPTLTFSNNTGFGDNIATDGEGGAVTISDFNIQVMPINSSGAKLSADPLEFHAADWSYPPIITYGSFNEHYGWAVKSDNGAEFSLMSIEFMDWGYFSGDIFVAEAFRNGTSLGTVTFAGNTTITTILLSQGGVLTSAFNNVDEVRIYKQGGGTSFGSLNGIQVGIAASTLPVSLMHFSASLSGKRASLQWSTAWEQHSRRFIVQHSTDGSLWKTIGTVAAAGSSNAERHYSYVHADPVAQNNYYRLAQEDLDGSVRYSEVVTLRMEKGNNTINVYPTPVVNGILNITLEIEAEVRLYNFSGDVLLQKRLPAGNHRLPVKHLPKGMYHILAGGESVRFLIQ